MEKKINFDCDGTWIDLFGVENWLDDLINERTRPYTEAKPLVNLSQFARTLNKLQRAGWEINIITWTAKNSNLEYHNAVTEAKLNWLHKHIPSVHWNNIYILPYGTAKHSVSSGILFDDEQKNRDDWGKGAYTEKEMLSILKGFLKVA